MNLKLLAPFILFAILGAGCVASNTGTNEAGHGHDEVVRVAKLAGSRILLDNRDALKTGEVDFRFKLLGLDGHEFGPNDLKIAHEKKLHLLLVRDDMTGFQHLHPEYINGKWTTKTNIPAQGDYQMYVDIAPEKESPSVLRVPVRIGGATVGGKTPESTVNLTTASDGIQVSLDIPGGVKAHETARLNFTLTQNGQPVEIVDPYLGAYGHVVLLRHNNPDDFFHVHPVTLTEPENGVVSFEAEFLTRGRYTLYAQFNIDGVVKTFPITLEVNQEKTGGDSVMDEKNMMHGGH